MRFMVGVWRDGGREHCSLAVRKPWGELLEAVDEESSSLCLMNRVENAFLHL